MEKQQAIASVQPLATVPTGQMPDQGALAADDLERIGDGIHVQIVWPVTDHNHADHSEDPVHEVGRHRVVHVGIADFVVIAEEALEDNWILE